MTMHVLVLATLAFLGSTTVARADPMADAKARFDAGIVAFEAGHYVEALRAFEDGYAIVPNPKFLLNMGQAYRKLGRLEEARSALLRYMSTLDATDPRRPSIAEIIESIDRELQRPPSQTTRPPLAAPPAVAAPTAVAASPTPRPAVALATPRSRRPARTAGIALVSLGGAAVVVGAVFVGVAVADNRLLEHPPPDWTFDPSVVEQRDALYPAGLSLLGVAGTSVAVGVGLLVVGRRRNAAN